MAQARVGEDGIKQRRLKIDRWQAQIEVWRIMQDDKSKGLSLAREATSKGISTIKDEIVDRVKTLSFATEADRLDLAKLSGKLEGLESIYYDIAEGGKKIEGAEHIIAKLSDEIKRAKKGELLDVPA